MDGNLLFSLCNCVEEQVFQTGENFRRSNPVGVTYRYKHIYLKESITSLLIAGYCHILHIILS